MWQSKDLSTLSSQERWQEVTHQLEHLVSTEEPLITGLSNAAALLYHSIGEINWAGFYLFDGEKLVLGPFGGLPACTQIRLGKGVCGTAAEQKEVIVVPDVDQFPGHIACDSASRSEIVLPLLVNGELFGVLDIDSPNLDRFSDQDKQALGAISDLLVQKIRAIKAHTPAISSVV